MNLLIAAAKGVLDFLPMFVWNFHCMKTFQHCALRALDSLMRLGVELLTGFFIVFLLHLLKI